ncbi:hypothetical protein GCM10010218_54620 [Streptomyces mashuensis]|uniref:Uncharacterized protein n=1 Tax=Streptomyces mashuensis TaxID=33904 RepID=A0A919B9A3_9ACTN|nr:hypothetical protein [Streptomyces mashuensis]GHF66193.1 hypothetical protein GCM10010218_54620 [Streptomyces mashuensis]
MTPPKPRLPRLARAVLDVIGCLHTLGGLILLAGTLLDAGTPPPVELVLGVAELTVASRFAKGGPKTRVAAMIVAACMVLAPLTGLAMGGFVGAAGVVCGLLVLALCAHRETAAWFARPRT